jgi:hypothetical protein
VVGLEGDAVGAAERLGQLVLVVGQVLSQGDAGKLKASAGRGEGVLVAAPFILLSAVF